jgi:antitoxin ParD1/3/4
MISADFGKALESYLTRLIESGRYGSKSEVFREGMRLIRDSETRFEAIYAVNSLRFV